MLRLSGYSASTSATIVAAASALLDSGAISQSEYEAMKAKALG